MLTRPGCAQARALGPSIRAPWHGRCCAYSHQRWEVQVAVAVILFFFVLFFAGLLISAGGLSLATLAGIVLICVLVGVPLVVMARLLEEESSH